MTTQIKARINRIRYVEGAFAGLFSAALEVDKKYEAPWMMPLLENIANNLTALEGPDWKDRVSILVRALNPQDALLLSQSEIPANGQNFVTEFFSRVPLLTEDQVAEKLTASNTTIDLNNLMQVAFADTTFYIADQFSENGSLRLELIELMKIFHGQSSLGNWDIAMWWINPTGWLSGDRPRDVFNDDFERVKYAAEQEVASDGM
jgi:hypothetical protein